MRFVFQDRDGRAITLSVGRGETVLAVRERLNAFGMTNVKSFRRVAP